MLLLHVLVAPRVSILKTRKLTQELSTLPHTTSVAKLAPEAGLSGQNPQSYTPRHLLHHRSGFRSQLYPPAVGSGQHASVLGTHRLGLQLLGGGGQKAPPCVGSKAFPGLSQHACLLTSSLWGAPGIPGWTTPELPSKQPHFCWEGDAV